ncbi:energy-coupling factor ABC transporter permease [Pseudomonas sp. SG20056]|uniref:energy-coupling factor ABC transporter permease n=1 Tax=Pseudomonas sp. SG20056 TaxID=3074146 RepID=UPI00287F8EBF|nr:energy-coupling factor ABC transporter permease [Pseudomonas sp. SG20056]WNF46156.1 energy-coupling factor ABC transporter permease [Pseudomonas sp. SG20056]
MIAAHLLSSTSQILGWLIYLPLLCWAIWRAPWVELCSDLRRQHLLGGTALALFALWLVRRDFDSGLSYHFIGMTAVTLLLDWPLAMLVVIPVWVTEACALWVEKKQPRNLFVYIFCSGFFAAALAALLCITAAFTLLWIDGLFPMPPWLEDFIGYLWLVIFPEAFINGMLVTALVVFYPDWLETFNRTRYLAAPWKDDDLSR